LADNNEEVRMRRQNPPQDHINKAQELEKFLDPMTIAAIYAIFGILFALFLSVVYVVLIHSYILEPTRSISTIFVVLGGIPLAFAFVAYFYSPRDPVSSYIKKLANAWRRPLDVRADEFVFQELLMDGEALCFKLAVYYPSKYHTADVKERLYNYLNGALAKDCSGRVSIPTELEIEEAVEPPLELTAAEWGFTVLYSEAREVCKLRGAYSNNLSPAADVWRTGTHY
jgi:hypothetical protein